MLFRSKLESVFLSSPICRELQSRIRPELYDSTITLDKFKQLAQNYFQGSKLNLLSGFDKFTNVDIVLGCTQFIDDLLLHYGLHGLQILAHDYGYYWRLDPNLQPAVVGELVPDRPLLISMPFAGETDIHPQMSAILDECLAKGIPVHIDSAWITCARDIHFDYSHPAIQSFAMSLSKGMDLSWNRIGLRWSRIQDDTNSVSIYNKFYMIPRAMLNIGYAHLEVIKPDHLWNLYGDRYFEICKDLLLRPTKMIHLARSMDRKTCYSVKHILEKSWK